MIDKPIESKRGVSLDSSPFYCSIQNQNRLFDKVWDCVDNSVNGNLSAHIGFNLRAIVTDSIWNSVRNNVQQECNEY